jgi:hypothetical protein
VKEKKGFYLLPLGTWRPISKYPTEICTERTTSHACTIDIRRVSRSFELVVNAACPPRKEELRGRESNSISNFPHHNINGGAVNNT